MKLKVRIKSQVTDRVLTPLRNELMQLIDENSTLLEIGCGTGDLIFKSQEKIRKALGVDLDQDMIAYAESKRTEQALDHISFTCANALELPKSRFDVATSTLCLHEMREQDACELLKMMVENSKRVLIADYTIPKTFAGKLSTEVDEMFSGHYLNFRRYRNAGEITSYALKIGAKTRKVISSSLDGISIWIIEGKLNA
ncbi:MAG: class I SAM-dependent methyltransferase [Candidatus Thiodiazotropha sp. 'RUGA']|nr:class I SAM-dependent methyltransferase [Candidatus Thiodiazotropha sp. 'RUGA']